MFFVFFSLNQPKIDLISYSKWLTVSQKSPAQVCLIKDEMKCGQLTGRIRGGAAGVISVHGGLCPAPSSPE